jgi:hypothetical protein
MEAFVWSTISPVFFTEQQSPPRGGRSQMGGGEVEAAAVHGGGVRDHHYYYYHPVAAARSTPTLLVSCWRPHSLALVPCADWGVFDEVRVGYAGVHTPETVARSLSSTHNPRSACCCHSPMYIPLLAADTEKIFYGPYYCSQYTMLLDTIRYSDNARH